MYIVPVIDRETAIADYPQAQMCRSSLLAEPAGAPYMLQPTGNPGLKPRAIHIREFARFLELSAGIHQPDEPRAVYVRVSEMIPEIQAIDIVTNQQFTRFRQTRMSLRVVAPGVCVGEIVRDGAGINGVRDAPRTARTEPNTEADGTGDRVYGENHDVAVVR